LLSTTGSITNALAIGMTGCATAGILAAHLSTRLVDEQATRP